MEIYISSIKVMVKTDISVQIYQISFLKVTAVRYDEKPDKDGQRCDIYDIVIRKNVLCLTVRLNQPPDGTVFM